MKRMYVTLSVILLLFVWAATSLGQKSPSNDPQMEALKRHLEMREEMHRRIRDKIFHGIGPDDSLFEDMDKMFEDMMKDSFSGGGISSFSSSGTNNFKMAWTESTTGRTLEITPKDKDQRLDISIENGFVTIKGNVEHKTPQGTSTSSFSNSFNVPSDCDPAKVKMEQKGEKILMHFPYIQAVKKITIPKKDQRVPVPPSEGDVAI